VTVLSRLESAGVWNGGQGIFRKGRQGELTNWQAGSLTDDGTMAALPTAGLLNRAQGPTSLRARPKPPSLSSRHQGPAR